MKSKSGSHWSHSVPHKPPFFQCSVRLHLLVTLHCGSELNEGLPVEGLERVALDVGQGAEGDIEGRVLEADEHVVGEHELGTAQEECLTGNAVKSGGTNKKVTVALSRVRGNVA